MVITHFYRNDLSEDYCFETPKIEEIIIFFKYHPIQIKITNVNSEKLYKKKSKHAVNWLLILNSNIYFSVQYTLHFIINLKIIFIKE